MALVADIAPPAKLGRYLGYAGLVFALTFVVGPLTGGLFVDHLSWRWAFFINLPAGLLGGAFVLALVPSARASAARTIDFAGIALLAATTTTTVLATSWGGVEYDWDSPVMLFLVAAAIAAAIGFVAWERRAPNPLIPLAVVRDRTIALAIVSNFIAGCGFTTAIVFLPVMFQAVAGMNATESGALLIPLGLGTALTTAAVGRIVEHAGGAKAIPALGMMLAIGAYAVLGTITVDSTAAYAATAGVFLGIGVGCVFQTMLFIVQRSVTIVHLGIVSSTVMLARLFGSALGVALFGSIFNNHLDGSFTGLPDLDLASLRGDPETIAALEPALRHDVSEAFADALAAGFRVFVVVMFVGLVSVVLQRGIGDPRPDHSTGHGSRGSPSSRSAMTLRWMSLVPPAIVRQRLKRKDPTQLPDSPSFTAPSAPHNIIPTSCTCWSCWTPSNLRTAASEPDGSAPASACRVRRKPSTANA